MSSTSNPFFLRHFLGDKPGMSGAGRPMSGSPDIILSGTKPVADLSELETLQNYETDPPNTMIVGSGETNYIYVRTLNTGTEAAGARLWLWYAEPTMLLWPMSWMSDKFNKKYLEINAAPNQIKVSNAFELLKPDAPHDHYCMIAIAQRAEEPAEAPFPGAFSSVNKFAEWIQEHPFAAWRNTIDQDSKAATWSYATPLVGPEQEESFYVGVQCKGMPVGAKYKFVVPGGRTKAGKDWKTVESGLEEIKNPNEGKGYWVTWPGGVEAELTITYYAEGTTAQDGAIIEPAVAQQSSVLTGLKDPRKGSMEWLVLEEPGAMQTAKTLRMHPVGGVPLRLT